MGEGFAQRASARPEVVGLWALPIAAAVALATPAPAQACGCFSRPQPPPDPPPGVTSNDFAVNQRAEQIVFEVHEERNEVTAHVLIQYEGDPSSFAWMLPVPSEPELDLGNALMFGLLDELTRPQIGFRTESLCPDARYVCNRHPACPRSGGGGGGGLCGSSDAAAGGGGFADAGGGIVLDSGTAGEGRTPPEGVDVLSREVIGAYETIVFSAGDMSAAIGWLQDEGFVTNETMTPYVQPYADEGMLFVIARLVPDADLDEIRPLAVTYAAERPMIPLELTAVSAAPELPVISYIYADEEYEPAGRPLRDIFPHWIARGHEGRVNYPMVLSRSVDAAGGDAFVREYSGAPVRPDIGGGDRCCSDDFDPCGLAGDGMCQCPGSSFDEADCADQEDLLEAMEEVDALAARHGHLTRLTTRMSPHEMTFDPEFRPSRIPGELEGRLRLQGTQYSLEACRDDVVEPDALEEVERRQACASVYCGDGECAVTSDGTPGCNCDPSFVARKFDDLDGEPSVTCVPADDPVDHSVEGIELEDSCANVECARGTCVDLNGFPACRCDDDAVAVAGDEGSFAPACRRIAVRAESPGAENFSEQAQDLDVCWPAPPDSCGDRGWLEPNPDIETAGVVCDATEPAPQRFEQPPPPSCGDGDDCAAASATAGMKARATSLALIGLALVLVRRRRRRR